MKLGEFLDLPIWDAPFWQALESIGALGTLIGIIYAIFQFREQKRIKEKPRIQEFMEVVIVPLIEFLERQRKQLKNGDIGYRKIDEECYIDIFKISTRYQGIEKLVYEDFLRQFPSLKERIENHDETVEEFLKSCRNFANSITSLQEFNKTAEEKIKKYNKERKENLRLEDFYRWGISWIIGDVKELDQGHIFYNFWHQHNEQFLSLRENSKIKKDKEEFEKTRNHLLELEEVIYRNLIKIREDLSKKYGIKSKS